MLNRRALFSGVAAVAFASPKVAKAAFFLGGGGSASAGPTQGIYNVKLSPYNAKGDGIQLSGGTMSSSSNQTHLAVAGAAFVSGDVGKTICVGGAGSSGAPLVTTIASVTDGTHVVLAGSCATTTSTAIVTYGTDDTSAIQSAINAAFTAGGGLVQFPPSLYMIAGALQNTSTHNAQLILPHVALGAPQISIVLSGEVPPQICVPAPTVLSDNLPPTSGAILYSPLNGSGTSPSILAAWTPDASDFSLVTVGVYNLTFRTAYLNTGAMQCLQMSTANNFRLESVNFDVDATSNIIAATAPVANSTGLNMPQINNGAKNFVVDSYAVGYDVGYKWTEHGNLEDVYAYFCKTGFYVQLAYHALYGTRIGAYSCKNGISGNGGGSGATKVPLRIEEFATEHNTTNWFASPVDVYDPVNTIWGSMTYAVVKSFVGYDNADFNKTGGTNFTCTALY